MKSVRLIEAKVRMKRGILLELRTDKTFFSAYVGDIYFSMTTTDLESGRVHVLQVPRNERRFLWAYPSDRRLCEFTILFKGQELAFFEGFPKLATAHALDAIEQLSERTQT